VLISCSQVNTLDNLNFKWHKCLKGIGLEIGYMLAQVLRLLTDKIELARRTKFTIESICNASWIVGIKNWPWCDIKKWAQVYVFQKMECFSKWIFQIHTIHSKTFIRIPNIPTQFLHTIICATNITYNTGNILVALLCRFDLRCIWLCSCRENKPRGCFL
jgi:hypothetical protein